MKLSGEQRRILRKLYDTRSFDARSLRGLEKRGLVMTIERADGGLSAVLTGDGVDAAIDLFLGGGR